VEKKEGTKRHGRFALYHTFLRRQKIIRRALLKEQLKVTLLEKRREAC